MLRNRVNFLSEKISRKKVFKCPFCRQDKDRFENLRVNHAIMELLDPVSKT